MISTIETKEAQLKDGYYQSGSGSEQILILGSCRTIPYLSYLVRWNDSGGNNRFTIRRIDPCDWAVENVDLKPLENDERILSVLKSCDIFIHEHLANYEMFNTTRDSEKNIYQFGMNPRLDISIPNFHDHFILENDYASCGIATPSDYIERGMAEIEKFCEVCRLSSFPEFADHFRNNWRTIRFFWRPNHVSSAFSLYIFRVMNTKFLHLDLTDEFWGVTGQEDLYRNPHTEVTQQDREAYGITW